MSHGLDSTVVCVLFPKISSGQKKLAPTGWHGWHVFATLIFTFYNLSSLLAVRSPNEQDLFVIHHDSSMVRPLLAEKGFATAR